MPLTHEAHTSDTNHPLDGVEEPKPKKPTNVDKVMAAFYKEAEEKKQHDNAILERRAAEERALHATRKNPRAVYVNIEEAVQQAYDDTEKEEPKKQVYQNPDYLVKLVPSPRGDVFTLPDLEQPLQGDWTVARFTYNSLSEDTWERVTPRGKAVELEKRGIFVQVDIERRGKGFSIEMCDMSEYHEATRRRLDGTLLQGTDPELGLRMGYIPNPATFIHPSVEGQTGQSLVEMLTAIHKGNMIDLTPPAR